jgi:DNA (cytosine-5)-methyltransferase 1
VAAYYNEHDPHAAAWLCELIREGLIADGEVDTRSIVDVRPGDLLGFEQCHFFAGIGGWSLALRLAGWADDRRVWTGSCPCQPFSSAGTQAGGHDPRDLWPAWFLLLRECRPAIVFGEQVEAAIAHGWYDRLCDDLEGEGYAVGASGLPAAGVGAFHIRQRLWFVGALADDSGARCFGPDGANQTDWRPAAESRRLRDAGDLADTDRAGQRSGGRRVCDERYDAGRRRAAGELGDTASDGLRSGRREEQPVSDESSYWTICEWIQCRDGKTRPVEPGSFPLAHGVPARVGRLRGYGNAIVPQVAAEFIQAYCEVRTA